MCNQGLFRKDLYYRLKVVPLTIPPLRERAGDIPMLTKHFITRYNEKYKAQKTIDARAALSLYAHYWPGNVRELEHVLERAFIMTDGHQISENIVKGILCENTNNDSIGGVICTGLMPLKDAKHEVERQLLAKALDAHKTTYQIAEALGVDQSTIVKLLKRINQPVQ
jgi:transcriptional regulator with PAS, ATPase and Fis domain